MAEICPVYDQEIGFWQIQIGNIIVHSGCEATYLQDPEKYGSKANEITEERQQTDKEINDKSVYVKGFSMPFGEMVEFMVKWAIASIPAFIILFIIFGILFAVFGALFF